MAFQSKPAGRTDTKPNNLKIHNKPKFGPMDVLERYRGAIDQGNFILKSLGKSIQGTRAARGFYYITPLEKR
jgi:hypothetical protein